MVLPKSRFIKEDYAFIGEDEKWHIKDDAPDWLKEEIEEFFRVVNSSPDENGVIVQISN